MVKIRVGKDCGNSPKNLFLRDFNIAVAKGNTEIIGQNITEDVTWHLFEPLIKRLYMEKTALLKST